MAKGMEGMMRDRLKAGTLGVLLAFVMLLATSPSMAAATYSAPYTKDSVTETEINDSTLLGSTSSVAQASKLDGSLSVDIDVESESPTGVQLQPQNRRPPIINVGRTDGYAAASIEQGTMVVPAADTYTITIQLEGVGATKTATAAAPTAGVNLSDAYAAASIQVYVYCYWNNAKSYSYVGIGPVAPSASSLTMSGSLACGGSGHIKTIVTLSGFATAKGTSSASIQASAVVSSITLTP